MKIGTATIGQTPREDVLVEMREILGRGIEILERGALDGLGREDLRRLGAVPGEEFLVTRLRDGSEVRVAEKHIPSSVARCIADLESRGVAAIILLCTAEFPDLTCARPLLWAGRILTYTARAVLPRGRLGVLIPAAEQAPMARRKWAAVGYELVIEAASPYSSSPAELENSARRLAEARVDLVALDCIGFARRAQETVRDITGKPVLCPRTLAARIAVEVIGSQAE